MDEALALCGEWCELPNPYCRHRAFFCLLRASNLCEHQTKAVFNLKLMVGWGEHKVVLDQSWFREYCGDADRGLSFLSV